MGFVAALGSTPQLADFRRKEGCFMIVRGEMPAGILPVAEFTDHDGRTFSLREIDQAEIALSFDYTVAWITARRSLIGQQPSVTALALNALHNAGIGFTSATHSTEDHLFVLCEKAPEALALLQEASQEFRMLESEANAIQKKAS
jgi:hypothetical protein